MKMMKCHEDEDNEGSAQRDVGMALPRPGLRSRALDRITVPSHTAVFPAGRPTSSLHGECNRTFSAKKHQRQPGCWCEDSCWRCAPLVVLVGGCRWIFVPKEYDMRVKGSVHSTILNPNIQKALSMPTVSTYASLLHGGFLRS